MMRTVTILMYNLIWFPLMIAGFHLLSLFDAKIRRGLRGRYGNLQRVRQFVATGPSCRHRFLIHCASMGEFEHIKPVIAGLREAYPDCQTVVMFFSPSGYEHVQASALVDLVIYAPVDGWRGVRRLFAALNPQLLLVARYDAWPNQLWAAQAMHIPRVLINAMMHDHSRRMHVLARPFMRTVYGAFDRILCISPHDAQKYRAIAGSAQVEVAGDTKFEQVIARSEAARDHPLLPAQLAHGRIVLVAGSTWPEDEQQLLPAFGEVRGSTAGLLLIIVPHEPTPAHLSGIRRRLGDIPACLLSAIDDYNDQPAIIVDRIGVLATLYALADIAYVGGSFRQNIHNVLEPAAYGVPVLMGPVNANSHEAQLLKGSGGGIEVDGAVSLAHALRRLISDRSYRQTCGDASRELVAAHRGATARVLAAIKPLLQA